MSTPLSTSCAHRVMVVGRHNIQTFTIICLWLVGNNTTASILFKTINNTFFFFFLPRMLAAVKKTFSVSNSMRSNLLNTFL